MSDCEIPTLSKYGINENTIIIDDSQELEYGSDQVYDSYPCRFGTVRFALVDTFPLVLIAERLRKDEGYEPLYLFPSPSDDGLHGDGLHSGRDEIERISSGWYEFSVAINEYNASKVDSCILFSLVNSESPDNEQPYYIDLSEEEQQAVYRCLDAQCRERLGLSCEKLLAIAHEAMLLEEEDKV